MNDLSKECKKLLLSDERIVSKKYHAFLQKYRTFSKEEIQHYKTLFNQNSPANKDPFPTRSKL